MVGNSISVFYRGSDSVRALQANVLVECPRPEHWGATLWTPVHTPVHSAGKSTGCWVTCSLYWREVLNEVVCSYKLLLTYWFSCIPEVLLYSIFIIVKVYALSKGFFFLRYCLYLFVCFGCARGYTSSCGARASLWFLLLWSTASRARELSSCGSRALEHGPSRSTACGIFPDQGWNPCLLHWQADSLPLSHQGSPDVLLLCLSVIVTYSNLCDSDALVFETCFAADNVVNSCKYSKCAWERDKLSHCWA